ncbi:hypothetical protein FB451DRAFT_1073565, partial [Mycena latifolia]
MKIRESEQPTCRSLSDEIKTLVAKLQLGPNCTAFMNNSDAAVNWRTYFDVSSSADWALQQGAAPFMSLALQDATIHGTPYVQSPIDDIESFFWLAFWAVLFNTHNQNRSSNELNWRKRL